jgi:hypothetical protein
VFSLYTSRLEAAIKQVNANVNNLVETELQDAPKFDPHRKLGFSTEAPAPSPHYDVTYDTKIGTVCNYMELSGSVGTCDIFVADPDPDFRIRTSD